MLYEQAQPLYIEAQSQYQSAYKVIQGVSTAAENIDLQRELSWVLGKLGDVAENLGQQSTQKFVEDALCTRRRLAGAPNSIIDQTGTTLRDLAYSFDRVGRLKEKWNDFGGAERDYDQSLGIRTFVATKLVGNVLFSSDVGRSRELIAEIKIAEGDLKLALAFSQAALQIRRQVAIQQGSASQNQNSLEQNERLVVELCSKLHKVANDCLGDKTSWANVVSKYENDAFALSQSPADIDECWIAILNEIKIAQLEHP